MQKSFMRLAPGFHSNTSTNAKILDNQLILRHPFANMTLKSSFSLLEVGLLNA